MEVMEQILAVIGGLLLVAKAVLEVAARFAEVTPSNADDEWVKRAHRFLRFAVKVADRLALNTDDVRARRRKERSV